MKKTEYPVPDPKNHDLTHIVTGSEDAILALQTLLNERRREGRSIGRAEAEDELQRLREWIQHVLEGTPACELPGDLNLYILDPGPEARGETPLPLELAG